MYRQSQYQPLLVQGVAYAPTSRSISSTFKPMLRRHLVANKPNPFQPMLPVRGATTHKDRFTSSFNISTHAPRAGSDLIHKGGISLLIHFNPRSPCGERRGHPSTCSGRRDFNPRSLCGERQQTVTNSRHQICITNTISVSFPEQQQPNGACKAPTLDKTTSFSVRTPCTLSVRCSFALLQNQGLLREIG